MTALYIILGIIAFIILLLSIKVMITVHYDEELTVSLSWLFLKFDLLPMKEKHPNKEKKKKEPEKTDEKIPEPKKKKDNMFVRFYHNQGVSGVVQLLKDAAAALGGMFRRIGRAFLFEELYVSLTVGSGDAANTAVKYGKVCAAAFPSMGFIVSNMRVKKYNIEVTPDFVGGSNSARMHVKTAVIPLRLINAVIVVAFQLLFKVVFKLLKHGKAKTADVEKQKKSNNT